MKLKHFIALLLMLFLATPYIRAEEDDDDEEEEYCIAMELKDKSTGGNFMDATLTFNRKTWTANVRRKERMGLLQSLFSFMSVHDPIDHTYGPYKINKVWLGADKTINFASSSGETLCSVGFEGKTSAKISFKDNYDNKHYKMLGTVASLEADYDYDELYNLLKSKGGTWYKPTTSSTKKPSTTKPSTTKPSTTKPSTTKPSTTKPSTTKPSTTKPSTTTAASPSATFTSASVTKGLVVNGFPSIKVDAECQIKNAKGKSYRLTLFFYTDKEGNIVNDGDAIDSFGKRYFKSRDFAVISDNFTFPWWWKVYLKRLSIPKGCKRIYAYIELVTTEDKYVTSKTLTIDL